jgi:hypothetical protein
MELRINLPVILNCFDPKYNTDQGSFVTQDPIDWVFDENVLGYDKISLNIVSIRNPQLITVTINDKTYSVPVGVTYKRIVLPLSVETLSLIQIGYSGTLIVGHLIAFKESIPSGFLWEFKRRIEEYTQDRKFLIGSVSVKAGDTYLVFDDWNYEERNLVLQIGNHWYQIANRVDNRVSFMTTYAGERILEDYDGDAYVVVPVEVGYYDREIALPAITLWYNDPTPRPRHSSTDKNILFIDGDETVVERDGLIQDWRITMEVACKSPELLHEASRAVRELLMRGAIWVYGIKTWWVWKDSVINSEPVEDYDILPRASYHVTIEIREGLWQWQKRHPVRQVVQTNIRLRT